MNSRRQFAKALELDPDDKMAKKVRGLGFAEL